MRAARNIAIIMLLALIVAEVPGGGNVADGIFAALTVGVHGRDRRHRLLRVPPEQVRLPDPAPTGAGESSSGSAGAITLVVAGSDEVVDWPGGVFILLGVIGIGIYLIFTVVMESRSV